MASLRHWKMGSFLNLVYDDWPEDQQKPNPNCEKKFTEKFGSGEYNVFNNIDKILDAYIFPDYKMFRLKNVYKNPNKFYCYPIETGDFQAVFNAFGHLPISDEVVKCLKECPNIRVLILNDTEYERKSTLQLLDSYIKDLDLDPKKFYWINNNSLLKRYKEELGTEINVHSSKHLAHTASIGLQLYKPEFVEDKSNIFLCHNRTPKAHRYALLTMMKKEGILDKGITDWSFLMGYKGRQDVLLGGFYQRFFDVNTIVSLIPEINYFLDIVVRKSDYERDKTWFNDIGLNPKIPWGEAFELKTYQNAYFNITTESEFLEDDVVHISEKSFKALYFYQFPLFLASKGHVKVLREEFGFDLFDDVLNHSYDDIEDPKERFLRFYDEIRRILEQKNRLIEFYKNNKKRFEYNHKKVIAMKYDRNDVNLLRNLSQPEVTNSVLITGCSGLVGSPLVNKCIEQGWYVIGVDKETPTNVYPRNKFKFIQADLSSEEVVRNIFQTENFQVVFNCFGIKGSPVKAKNNPVDFLYPSFKINTEIINQSYLKNVWLVFMSSIGVYNPEIGFSEDQVWNSLPSKADWFPSWSKRTGELLLEAYRDQYDYKKWTIVRPANIFGNNDDFSGNGTVISSTIKKISEASNEIECWGDGSPIRDFVYADDVAKALIDLYNLRYNDAINFGSGDEITIKRMVESLVAISGKSINVKWDSEKPNGDSRRQMNISKQKSIGLLPETKFEDALRMTYENYSYGRINKPEYFRYGFHAGKIDKIINDRELHDYYISKIKEKAFDKSNYHYRMGTGSPEIPYKVDIDQIQQYRDIITEKNIEVHQTWYETIDSGVFGKEPLEYFRKIVEDITLKIYPELKDNIEHNDAFTLYEDGDFIQMHQDGLNPGRMCVVLIYLNDPKEYYDGGGQFITTMEGNEIAIDPTSDNFVMLDFLANNAEHAVEPVKNGFKRLTYINFVYNLKQKEEGSKRKLL